MFSPALAAGAVQELVVPRPRWSYSLKAGLALLVIFVLLALLAGVLSPHEVATATTSASVMLATVIRLGVFQAEVVVTDWRSA